MKALLLAAGLGTRLYPVTANIPKCLVPIHGRALLDWWLELLVGAGVEPLLINLHYLADAVTEHLAESPYQSKVVSVYEEHLLGTAGTLHRNRDFFGNEPVMLIHADNLSLFDARAFIQRHEDRPCECEITMMTFDTDTPCSCGIVELDGREVVIGFHEKVQNPPGSLANGAVYIIEPTVFDFLAGLRRDVIDFSTEVLPQYLGRIYTFKNVIYHRDIGTVASYQTAQSDMIALLKRREP